MTAFYNMADDTTTEHDAGTPSQPAANCAYTMNGPPGETPCAAPDLPSSDDDRLSSVLDKFCDIPYLASAEPEAILDLSADGSFTKLFSILYTVFSRNELSPRVHALTAMAMKENPSNPTVWLYRRKLAEAQAAQSSEKKKVWEAEMAFTATVLKLSRKNYQAWEHRRHCVQQTHLYGMELDFIDIVLHDDAKNYHAWSYRAWLCIQLTKHPQPKHALTHEQVQQIMSSQFQHTDWFIDVDVRNNSAWNFRSFLILQLQVTTDSISPQSEINFACDMAARAPRNESPWNYLLALARQCQVDITVAIQYANRCISIDAGCVAARRFLILGSPRDTPENIHQLEQHCTLLADGIDPIRKKYWLSQRQSLSTLSSNILDKRKEEY